MKYQIAAALAASLFCSTALQADTLELRRGQVIEGTYQGGTAETIRFQTGTATKVFQRSEIVALTLSGGATAAQPANAGASATMGAESAPATGAGQSAPTVTLPQGTALQIRMVDGVDSSKDAPGKRFTGTLESNLSANGVTLAPAGTTVHGQLAQAQQAGRVAGQSVLSLVLTDIVLNGEAKPLSTEPLTMTGQAEGRQTARRGAAGAIIGGIAGGGEGAGKGAAIGAGTAAVKKGQAVSVLPGALVEFRLNQPLTVKPSS
ncbi:MAG TPA: hypothetical protein VNT26_07855 [Candidatus Sulfotelmatobacter sp.]|nr:hypothetical protein [Candidatus Sulfotelmatobacter sp.]